MLQRVGWNVEADGLFGAPPISVFIGDDARDALGVDASLAARNIDGGTGLEAVQRQLAHAHASITR